MPNTTGKFWVPKIQMGEGKTDGTGRARISLNINSDMLAFSKAPLVIVTPKLGAAGQQDNGHEYHSPHEPFIVTWSRFDNFDVQGNGEFYWIAFGQPDDE